MQRAPEQRTSAQRPSAQRPSSQHPFPQRPPLPQAARSPSPPPAAAAAAPAGEGVRLSKHLSDQGLASRREADEWIAAGWVRVDGQAAVLGQRVLPHQHVEIDPAARTHQSRSVTILLHKPIGYVSGQAEDGYQPAATLVTPANHWAGDPARIPFNRAHLRGLAPAGRLDIDSTGLLVLTQDGRIARHLIGDDSKVEKEYLVRVAPLAAGSVRDDALQLLNHGLELDGKPLKPAKVSWQNEDQLRFVLREGRKRQIRRMCELVGFKVLALKRVRIGSVVLGKLPPGQWRYLAEGEKF
ncbi:MAG: pseudouridine synthase [Pseudomonadota bacterium]